MANKTKTALYKSLKRNTHKKCLLEVTGKHPASMSVARLRKSMRWYVGWMISKIAAGERVQLIGLGTIHGTFRKGRSFRTRIHGKEIEINQPDTFSLKIKASPRMRKLLAKLAAVADPKTAFKGDGKPLCTTEPSEV